MRAQHVDRTKRVWQMGSGMKGNYLLAVFMTITFTVHPRPLTAQDAPIDESTVAATIDAADADLENDQDNADKAKAQNDKANRTADDSSQTGSGATADDSSNQPQNQSPANSPGESANGAASPASDQFSNAATKGAEQPSPALEPAPASANGTGNGNPQHAVNAQNVSQASSAAVAPGAPPGGDIVAPPGPKSEIALATANLMKLANDLKSEVDKTSKDTLSVTVVREADQIEQLARKMRTK